MPTTGRGHPAHANQEKDQCEAITTETAWKREKKKDLRCPFVAKLVIGGKRLCGKHAQCEAVAILYETGKAQIIPSPQTRIPYQPIPTAKSLGAR